MRPSPARHHGVIASLAAMLLGIVAPAAIAQQTGMLLVAKPHLLDPNFTHTVMLVTQAADGAAFGVILNRPTPKSLARMLPDRPELARFTEPLYFGGPVETVGLFAVFRNPTSPGEAFAAGSDLWLALRPTTVEQLIHSPPKQLRFYIGYAGWAPGQLAREVERGDWWVLDVDPDVLFLEDTGNLWLDLMRRATSVTASFDRPRAYALLKRIAPTVYSTRMTSFGAKRPSSS